MIGIVGGCALGKRAAERGGGRDLRHKRTGYCCDDLASILKKLRTVKNGKELSKSLLTALVVGKGGGVARWCLLMEGGVTRSKASFCSRPQNEGKIREATELGIFPAGSESAFLFCPTSAGRDSERQYMADCAHVRLNAWPNGNVNNSASARLGWQEEKRRRGVA